MWDGFLLGKVRGQIVPCRFSGRGPDGDCHLFWECTYLPVVEILDTPDLLDLMRMDRGLWPRCLLWHGWLLALSGCSGGSRRAVDEEKVARNQLEVAMGAYSSHIFLPLGCD